ncbi:MAG: hypothetical protein WC794_02970 [Candidatus Doudnabacteria bacterium]|jgi:hypothetical protein
MTNGIGRLLIMFWLLVSSSGLVLAQCPQGKTVFIWVNGILVKDLPTWESEVGKIGDEFLTSRPNLNPNCVKFYPVYNHSVNLYRDLLQSDYQIGMQDVDKYLNDLNLLNTAPKAHQSFMAAALGYQKDLQSGDPDMLAIDQAILDWWSQGYRVVLVGHSQGTLYSNTAYNIRLRNADGKGKQLPNSNHLSVVNIATPANNVADGRQMYTTHCNDFIYYAPNNVGGKALPWNIRDSFAACAVASTANFVLNFFNAAGELVKLGYSVPSHLLGTYMADNSNAQKQIYQHLEGSLPDPGCGIDINCYLKESFSGNGYATNWQLTDYTGAGARVDYGGNKMDLNVFHTMENQIFGGKLVIRTRRVFPGPFNASLSFKNITKVLGYAAGYGTSVISLKRASDDSSIISLTLTDDTGNNWHQMKITRTDTQVSMTVDNQTWVGQSASVVSSTLTDGYYIEVKTQGNDILSVSNLSVGNPVFVGPIPPTTSVVAPPTNLSTVVK